MNGRRASKSRGSIYVRITSSALSSLLLTTVAARYLSMFTWPSIYLGQCHEITEELGAITTGILGLIFSQNAFSDFEN